MAKLTAEQVEKSLAIIRQWTEGREPDRAAVFGALSVAIDALTDRLQWESGEWSEVPDTVAWQHLQAIADVITPLKQELGLTDGFKVSDAVAVLADAYNQLRRIGGYPLENAPRPSIWDRGTVLALLDDAGRFNAERTEKTTSIGFILAALRIMNGETIPLIKDGE